MLTTYKLNGKPACYDPENSMIVGKPKPDPRPSGPFASCGDCPYISQGFICFSREGDCMRTYMQNIRKKNRRTINEPR